MILEFTPLEFETVLDGLRKQAGSSLEFTPLEFETVYEGQSARIAGN